MDVKRLLFALGLSFLFIMLWGKLFPPPVNGLDQQNVAKAPALPKLPAPSPKTVEFSLASSLPEWQDTIINVLSTNLNINLNNGGTSIKSLEIIEKTTKENFKHLGAWTIFKNNEKKYDNNHPVQLINNTASCNPCLEIDGVKILFSLNRVFKNSGNIHVLSTSNDAFHIVKETIIYEDSFIIDHRFSNLPHSSASLLWADGLLPSEKNIADDVMVLTLYAENKDTYTSELLNIASTENGGKSFYNDVGWLAIKTKYFIKAITNESFNTFKADSVVVSHTIAEEWVEDEFVYADMLFNYSNLKGSLNVYSYIGPMDTQYLQNTLTNHLVDLFGFGWSIIGYLGQAVLWLLMFLYQLIPNYGVVCILFAFIIRIFTGPLTKKSFLSNQRMQSVQPKMKAIQTKYKDNPTQLNQEIVKLYKKEGVNPLGGCLPILVQMPLLIALFQVFRKTIEFRGAPFLPFWITDLSQPDVVIQFDFLKEIWGISYFFGHGIALLPIIMGVVMFLNMRMTAAAVNPSQMSTMYIMNGFFILLFNTFPSGLNLYYTVYNVLNFIQQKKLKQISV